MEKNDDTLSQASTTTDLKQFQEDIKDKNIDFADENQQQQKPKKCNLCNQNYTSKNEHPMLKCLQVNAEINYTKIKQLNEQVQTLTKKLENAESVIQQYQETIANLTQKFDSVMHLGIQQTQLQQEACPKQGLNQLKLNCINIFSDVVDKKEVQDYAIFTLTKEEVNPQNQKKFGNIIRITEKSKQWIYPQSNIVYYCEFEIGKLQYFIDMGVALNDMATLSIDSNGLYRLWVSNEQKGWMTKKVKQTNFSFKEKDKLRLSFQDQGIMIVNNLTQNLIFAINAQSELQNDNISLLFQLSVAYYQKDDQIILIK